MTLMLDSVNWQAIPPDTPVVAGYINGRYAWPAEAWARFPNSKKLRIQIFIPGVPLIPDGDLVDLELQNVNNTTIAQVITWGRDKASQLPGFIPGLYISRSVWWKAVNFPGDFWIADWEMGKHLLPGAAAVQWDSTNNYDISETQPWFPRGPIPVPPPPSPTPTASWTERMLMELPSLQMGASGQHVRVMQSLLIGNSEVSNAAFVDGNFGAKTQQALQDWQHKAGLVADGICGPITWHHLLNVS